MEYFARKICVLSLMRIFNVQHRKFVLYDSNCKESSCDPVPYLHRYVDQDVTKPQKLVIASAYFL